MVYLLKMVIFHGYVSHNQRVRIGHSIQNHFDNLAVAVGSCQKKNRNVTTELKLGSWLILDTLKNYLCSTSPRIELVDKQYHQSFMIHRAFFFWQVKTIIFGPFLMVPIGSMVLLYMVTWIPSIYPSHVSIYTSTMDPMGYIMLFYYCYYKLVYRPFLMVHRSRFPKVSGIWFRLFLGFLFRRLLQDPHGFLAKKKWQVVISGARV